MAITEACQVWLEQRITEEKEKGTPDPEIGRILASEILKYFEVGIKPRTIEQRSRRLATNVASDTTPSPSTEILENQDSEPAKTENVSDFVTCEECGKSYRLTPCNYGPDGCPHCFPPSHGGNRKGSGRPTKYEQETDTLFNLKRWWRLAAKRDRKAFLIWIQEEGK